MDILKKLHLMDSFTQVVKGSDISSFGSPKAEIVAAVDSNDNTIKAKVSLDAGTDPEAGPLLKLDHNNDSLVPPWRTSIVLSLTFFLVCTSSEAVRNIQIVDGRDTDQSMTSFSLIYFTNLIGSFLAPTAANFLGHKNLILVCFFCNLLYVCVFFRPSYATVMVGSALLGLTTSGASVSSSIYSVASSRSHIAKNSLDEKQELRSLSVFNGIFFFGFTSSKLVGNAIPSLFLTKHSTNASSAPSECGARFCSTTSNTTADQSYDSRDLTSLLVLLAGTTMTGIVTACFLLPKLRFGDIRATTTEFWSLSEAVLCIKEVLSLKFLLLASLFIMQATNSIVMTIVYPKAFVMCSIGVYYVGYTITVYCGLTAVSSIAINNALGQLGLHLIFSFALAAKAVSSVVLLLWEPQQQASWGYLFILPAVTGVAEGIILPQTQAILVSVIRDNLPATFSAAQACRCLTSAAVLFVSTSLCTDQLLRVTIAVNGLGIIGYVTTMLKEIFPCRSRPAT